MTEEEKKTKQKKKKHHDGDETKGEVVNADVTDDHPNEGNVLVEMQQKGDTVERATPVNNNTDNKTNHSEVSTLNAYYGNFKGFLATVSLILNSGLMVYAHLGLSAVVLSSRPPIPAGSTSPTSPPLGGLCNENDLIIWQDKGGQVNRRDRKSVV